MTIDPYRTLALAPGATQAEIKRAYRRLVKEHHPDSGGPAELSSFLAIQAAYEMLTSGRAIGSGAGPYRGQGPADTAPGVGNPWRADPARARAAREAWRRQGTRGRAGDPGSARGGGPGGADGTAHDSGPAAGARRGAGAGADGPTGGAAGAARTGERSRDGTRPRREHRPRKATLGSTTYDEVHHDPDEPGWSGSSWYGQASGTYWTINPREYADPRKHGPEYQARARRAAQTGTGPTLDDEGTTGAARNGGPSVARGRWTTDATGQRRAPEPDGRAAPPDRNPGMPPDRNPGMPPDHNAGVAPGWGTSARRSTPPRPPAPATAAEGAFRSPIGLSDAVGWIVRAGGGRRTRLALALIAWPPLGVAAALMMGEITGCARFAAGCAGTQSFTLATVAAQGIIIAVLLALPGAASLAAFGSLATVLAAVPVLAFLVAVGAPFAPDRGSGALLAMLGVAWLVGAVAGWRSLRRATGEGDRSNPGRTGDRRSTARPDG